MYGQNSVDYIWIVEDLVLGVLHVLKDDVIVTEENKINKAIKIVIV